MDYISQFSLENEFDGETILNMREDDLRHLFSMKNYIKYRTKIMSELKNTGKFHYLYMLVSPFYIILPSISQRNSLEDTYTLIKHFQLNRNNSEKHSKLQNLWNLNFSFQQLIQ